MRMSLLLVTVQENASNCYITNSELGTNDLFEWGLASLTLLRLILG
jgi:hypothetical protein